MAKQKETTAIIIPAIKKEQCTIRVKSTEGSTLIVHRFSEKIQKDILDKMKGKAKQAKPPKNPEQEYRDSMYWLDKDGRMILPNGNPTKHKTGFGMPSRAFKKAMVSACRSIDGVPMTIARNSFHVLSEFVPLLNHDFKTFAKPRIRTEPLRLPNSNSMDMRSRGEFVNWAGEIQFEFNANVITKEQLLNLIQLAGFGVGVGEDRPDKTGGVQGRFEIT